MNDLLAFVLAAEFVNNPFSISLCPLLPVHPDRRVYTSSLSMIIAFTVPREFEHTKHQSVALNIKIF